MPDKYDFQKMFSQSDDQIKPDDFRAYNTLYMSHVLNRPVKEIDGGYDEVVKNFTGEQTADDKATFQKLRNAVIPAENIASEWSDNINLTLDAEEPPVYNGGFWNEVGTRAIEGIEMGEARAKATIASAVDLVPAMARGAGQFVTQIGEGFGVAEDQQEFFDDIMSNPFIATMLDTPSRFITETGEFNNQAKKEMRELSEQYGKPAVVVDELSTTVLDTMMYLQAIRIGGIQIGMTPAQASGKELSTQMVSRLQSAGKLAAFKGIFSEASSLQERADIASITAMYMGTPAASGLFEGAKSVFIADLALNSAITYPQVNELWAREDLDDFDKVLETVKMVGSDLVFSAMTKTMRGNRLSPNWKPMQEAARQLTKDAENAEHRANFEKSSAAFDDPKNIPKPGSSLNRIEGEADKATENGQGFVNAEIAKTQTAKEIENLKRNLIEQERAEAEQPKPDQAPDQAPAPAEKAAQIEREVGSVASERRRVLLDTITRTAEMNLDKRVDEINRTMQDLADKNTQAHLAGLDIAVREQMFGKDFPPTEDTKSGAIPETVRTNQSVSKFLEPPKLVEDVDEWIDSQIKYISSLMRIGDIKNLKDYQEVLDRYEQHDGIDSRTIYDEAKKAVKIFKQRIKDAERSSASGKITQRQFLPEKTIIKVDEYQMLKKQIRDYNKGAKAGKILGRKEQITRQKERDAQIKDIRTLAIDYARSQIHSKDLMNSVRNTIDKITTKSQLDKVLAKIDERVAEQKQRDAVKGVEKELKKLNKMKLHPAMQKTANALLEGIATRKTSDKKIGSIIKSKDFFSADIREDVMPDYLAKAIDGLADKQLRDMTTEDLNILKMGIQQVRSNQKLREELTERGQRRKIEKLATEFDSEVRNPENPLMRFDKEGFLKDPKTGGLFGALNKLDLNPDGQAFVIDGGKEGIAHQVFVKNFWAGDDRRLTLEQHAGRYMEPHHNTIKGWDEPSIPAVMGSTKVKISRGERIAIYLDSLNPQNESHQLKGGYVLRSNPGIRLKITDQQRDAIIDGMKADDYMIAQTIQDGYQNILRPALNETSIKIIGHEIAVIDNYHPMSSAKMFMDSEGGKLMPVDLKSFSEYLLGSSGHFKERVAEAKNPIILQDAIKKYDQMVSLISKYHGYAEPLRDAKQFLNGKTADGIPVRQVISSTRGTKYNEMMDDLLKDLEGGYEKSTRGWLRKSNAKLNKATNNIVRGILGHNIKVAGLQPISYATAKNVIPIKYWAIGAKSMPASWEEMGEHSPLMWDRGKGHLSIAFGESTKEKKANRGMQMIRTMDRNAVGRIWRAFEAQSKDENKGVVDYKQVAERTNDAVRRTQPTFEIIDRPAIARTDNVLFRALSMFTSQRNKNHTLKLKNDVGMLDKLKDGSATEKDWNEWGQKTVINRLIVPTLVAGYQAAWGIILGKKYEEDERSIWNRFGNKYIDSQLSEAGPLAGAVLGEVKAVLSGLNDSVEGREVSSALVKTYKNLERDVGVLAKVISDEEESYLSEDREKVRQKRIDAVESLIRNLSIASGRGEYHYYDYAKTIKAWTKEEGEKVYEGN